MKLINALTTAIAGSILCAGSAIAAVATPDCVFPSETLRLMTTETTAVCQDDRDRDRWTEYEFSERYDGMFDLASSVSVNRYTGFDVIAVNDYRDRTGNTRAIFWLENDGRVTGTDGQNMVYAALQQNRINELLRSRRYWIGY